MFVFRYLGYPIGDCANYLLGFPKWLSKILIKKHKNIFIFTMKEVTRTESI